MEIEDRAAGGRAAAAHLDVELCLMRFEGGKKLPLRNWYDLVPT